MKKNIVTPIIAIVVALFIVGGGAYWYFQNDEVIFNISQINNSEDEVGPVAATLAYQKGEVLIKVDNGEWLSVETDTVLHQGDSIKTGEDSTVKAIIELENGDVIRLGYNTEISLASLKTDAIKISQVSGASYHRVAKNHNNVYEVSTPELTAQAMGTAFDVIIGNDKVEIGVVESKVKVIAGNNPTEITEGESALFNIEQKNIEVTDIDNNELTNDWYTWNKEEDSKRTDQLGILSDYAGPTLKITTPVNEEVVDNDQVTIEGTVSDFEAKLFVNDVEIDNKAGQYSQKVDLVAGKNIITVVAEDSNGFRTIQEIKVIYQIAPPRATPLELRAETKKEGVYLEWNTAAGLNLKYYKVVRSETNADLKYPDNGYIAVNGKGREHYTDTDVSINNTYYYRVCEVYEGDNIYCSNVINMKGKIVEDEDKNIQKDETDKKEITDDSNKDKIGLFLSAEAESDGIHLSWSVEGMEVSNGFKVVVGEAENPVYPGNDYKYLSDSKARNYIWATTNGRTNNFRVCQYNGDGACLIYSNNVEIKAYDANVVNENDETNLTDVGANNVTVTLSAKAESSGVGLWWNDMAESVTGFKYYKVVRSETNADLKYPDDSYIAVKSEGDESYRDYAAKNGKSYYYRICAVGEQIYCSNVMQVTPIHDNAVPSAVTLSASYAEGKVVLSWTQSGESDFKYYKVVWSQTNATPKYPADGYIKAISDRTTVSYNDEGDKSSTRSAAADLSTGTHYYSVCVVDSQTQVTCSNVITLVNGVI